MGGKIMNKRYLVRSEMDPAIEYWTDVRPDPEDVWLRVVRERDEQARAKSPTDALVDYILIAAFVICALGAILGPSIPVFDEFIRLNHI